MKTMKNNKKEPNCSRACRASISTL